MATDIKRLIRKKTTLIQQKQENQETITQKKLSKTSEA
jgi:hypothetical protein